jgi:hypothetical protein
MWYCLTIEFKDLDRQKKNKKKLPRSIPEQIKQNFQSRLSVSYFGYKKWTCSLSYMGSFHSLWQKSNSNWSVAGETRNTFILLVWCMVLLSSVRHSWFTMRLSGLWMEQHSKIFAFPHQAVYFYLFNCDLLNCLHSNSDCTESNDWMVVKINLKVLPGNLPVGTKENREIHQAG